MDVDANLSSVANKYKANEVDLQDGVKIYFEGGEWVHLRKSNTEPIIRIYSESKNKAKADELAGNVMDAIRSAATA